MGEQGRRELPRPPRRVPSWAAENAPEPSGPRTTIEPRRRAAVAAAGGAGGDELPPRFRPRFVLPLVVFVLVLGAAAGWLVRADSLSLDTKDVQEAVGPAVVRVLATTCEGTGQASGVLLPGGLVLTAASAIRSPISVAVLLQDGAVRRATVNGSTSDGVALLSMAGPVDKPTAGVEQEVPDPKAERAVVAYDLGGEQVVVPAGTAEQPRELAGVVDAGALGAPVVDRKGRLIGVFTGDTVAAGKIVPTAALPFARNVTGLFPEPVKTCQSRGPQTPVEPDLAVANTPLAGEVSTALGEYLDALNQHDFTAMQTTYSTRLRSRSSAKVDASKHGTSYAFGAVIDKVAASGAASDADADMMFTVLFSPTSTQANGQTCAQLRIRYHLVREQQRLRIDGAQTLANRSGCDTD
ncbi:serine protease [Kribbella sp. NPDC051770]|uniref:S1 family peptidase n=1 Tax=Kribbella sp. NPDC051770 TaxID=3155413 RepID=UPI00341ED106